MSDVDISELTRVSRAHRTTRDGHRHATARDVSGRSSSTAITSAASSRSPRATGVDQWRLLRARAGGLQLHRATIRRLGTGAAAPTRRPGPAGGLPPHWLLGGRWIRCATRTSWKSCGPASRRPGRYGNESTDFWRGKRVLLTGHTGFKGAGCRCGCRSSAPTSRAIALPPSVAESLFELGRSGRSDAFHLRAMFATAKLCRARSIAFSPESSSTWRRSRWCAARTLEPVETYAGQCDGHGSCAGCGSQESRLPRRRQRHQRQVLRKQGMDLGLSRRRSNGRPRSLLQQQGLCGARDRGVSPFLLRRNATVAAWHCQRACR